MILLDEMKTREDSTLRQLEKSWSRFGVVKGTDSKEIEDNSHL